LGGINNYQYVPNPVSWIDPLGLSCKEQKPKTSIARVNHYEPDANNAYGHYSVEMITDDKKLHTHQVITSPDKSSTTIVSASEYPPGNPLKRSIDIEVPNADNGIEYQESKIWEELGPYSEKQIAV
jgi:uncharacterized protein RhaS with RHS repeats